MYPYVSLGGNGSSVAYFYYIRNAASVPMEQQTLTGLQAIADGYHIYGVSESMVVEQPTHEMRQEAQRLLDAHEAHLRQYAATHRA
jgi:hypothetical protein